MQGKKAPRKSNYGNVTPVTPFRFDIRDDLAIVDINEVFRAFLTTWVSERLHGQVIWDSTKNGKIYCQAGKQKIWDWDAMCSNPCPSEKTFETAAASQTSSISKHQTKCKDPLMCPSCTNHFWDYIWEASLGFAGFCRCCGNSFDPHSASFQKQGMPGNVRAWRQRVVMGELATRGKKWDWPIWIQFQTANCSFLLTPKLCWTDTQHCEF